MKGENSCSLIITTSRICMVDGLYRSKSWDRISSWLFPDLLLRKEFPRN